MTIPEWETITKTLYEKAQQTLNDSALLRSVIDNDLEQNSNKLRNQADKVDIALARFISDTQQVSKSIEIDLQQVTK